MHESRPDRCCDVLVLGAGLCGLSTAYHLEQFGDVRYLVVERNHEVGGLCRTETYDGFSFDHSIHILYTRDRYAAGLIGDILLPGQLCKQPRESYCYTAGIYTEYPYQANNYGLPAEIITSNILGLINAREHASYDSLPAHFEEWIYRTFGAGIAEHFMIPYNRRVWAWDLTDMSYEWIAERVPMPEISEVVSGALKPPEKKFGPNREFWYPSTGGIESLSQALGQRIPPERLWLNTRVIGVDAQRHCAILADGRHIRYERMVSSLPMPALIGMMGEDVPREVHRAASGLKCNAVHTVNIGLEGTHLGLDRRMHWSYFPEDTTDFHRLSFPCNFAASMAPPGCCSIQAEISESVYQPRERHRLVERTLAGLVAVGLLTDEETRPVGAGGRVCVAKVMTLDPAYIIYDLRHQANTDCIKQYLQSLGIETRGRFGEWEYFNMDHTILSGRQAALLTRQVRGI